MEKIDRQLSNPAGLRRNKEKLFVYYLPFLNQYLENLSAKFNLPEIEDLTKTKILEVIYRNTLMADILESQEFLNILKAEKELRGEAKVGIVQCIDGRLSILHQFGRAISVKEIAGSLIALNKRETKITDRRFTNILKQTADEKRELLEIVTAHTSLRHIDHRCSRITGGVISGEFKGEVDEVAWQQAEKRAFAIENKYNDILRSKRKPPQAQVSITAMIDTDTMGLVLNFGQENQLSTTDLTWQLAQEIEQKLGEYIGEFGSMRDRFADPLSFIEYSQRVLKVTKYLMQEKFNQSDSEVNRYISDNFPKLSVEQQQALLFTICRTIANQYVTGLASEEEFSHPYLEHSEDYMVVSSLGKALGGFDMIQSFGSVPANRREMLKQVKTKLSLLDNNRAKKPYLLFISTPINKALLAKPDISLVGDEDAAIVYFQKLFADSEIKKRIKTGSLIIIPVLIDEENRKPFTIEDYLIFLN